MNITLHFRVKRYQKSGYKSAVDIQCKATSACNDDTNIFMIQKLPKNFNRQPDYRFSHVADPVDMQDYPTELHDDFAYFRVNHIKLRVRNDFQAEHVIQGLKSGASALVRAMNYIGATQSWDFEYNTGGYCSDSKSDVSDSHSISSSQPEGSDSYSISISYSESKIISDSCAIQDIEFDIIQDLQQQWPSDSSAHPIDLCSHIESDGQAKDKL